MLTRLETRILRYTYTVCCKYWTIPWIWKGNRMVLKTHPGALIRMWESFSYILLLSVTLFRIKLLPGMISEKNINGCVLNGVLLITNLGHLMLKVNVLLYKTEISQTINQVLQINSIWGKNFILYRIFALGKHTVAHDLCPPPLPGGSIWVIWSYINLKLSSTLIFENNNTLKIYKE